MKNLAIIIPTKNRASLLSIALTYYDKNNFDCLFYIIDSSRDDEYLETVNFLKSSNLNILHERYMEKGVGAAIAYATRRLPESIRYVTQISDDDLHISKSAILRAIKFLHENKFSGAYGPTINDDPSRFFGLLSLSMATGKAYSSHDRINRVRTFLEADSNLVFGLFERERFELAYSRSSTDIRDSNILSSDIGISVRHLLNGPIYYIEDLVTYRLIDGAKSRINVDYYNQELSNHYLNSFFKFLADDYQLSSTEVDQMRNYFPDLYVTRKLSAKAGGRRIRNRITYSLQRLIANYKLGLVTRDIRGR